MLTMATATLIGAIISGVIATGSAIANTVSQAKTNQTNKQNVQDTNAMNEQLTREQWKRDDSQLQRARADAEAAGFSPLAALSNNLTNSAAATMQAPQQIAPQFDSSGIVESIQSGVRDYNNSKVSEEQKKYIKEQTKALSLENAFNATNNFTRKLQNLANLAKTMRELDSQNLDNYQKASILVASGIPKDIVQKLISHTKETVVRNTSQDALIKLQKAQADLATEEKTTQQKMQALYDAQKALVDAQKDEKNYDNNWWYSPLAQKGTKNVVNLPDIEYNSNNNTYQIVWKQRLASDTNRKMVQTSLDQVLQVIEMHKGKEMLNKSDWEKLGILLGALK